MDVEVQNSDETTQDVLTTDLCQHWSDVVTAHVPKLGFQQQLDGAVCIRTVGLAESQSLNQTFRGKDRPTNVLSFPADVDVDEPILGDLALCWPVVEGEAVEQGKSVLSHATHLVIHGLLHLLGFDHEEDTQAEEMEALEIRILAELNVENPYL